MSFTSTYNNLSVRGYQAPNNTYIGRLSAPTSGGQFGFSLSLSGDGNTLIVGAPVNNRVYIFNNLSNVWTLSSTITKPSGNTIGNFGRAVGISFSGNIAIIGAPTPDFGFPPSPGHAYIYGKSGNTWSLQANLVPNVTSNIDQFGYSVSINDNGDKVAFGSPSSNAAANVYPKVVTFSGSGNSWTQTATLQTSPLVENTFGGDLSMDGSGNYIAVGTLGGNGNLYVYNNLSLQQTITSNTGSGNAFGTECSFNSAGTRLLIKGANIELFDRVGNTWSFTSSFSQSNVSTTSLSRSGNAFVLGSVVYVENNPGSWTVPLILQPNDITYEPAGSNGPFSSAIQYPGYTFAGYPNDPTPTASSGAVGVWQLT